MRSLLPRLVVTVAFAGLMQVACSSDDSSGNGGTGGTGTGGRGGAGGAGTGGSGTGGTGTGGTGTGGSGTGGAGTGGTGTGGSGSGGAGGTGGTGTGGGSGGGGGADAAGSETGGADTAPGGDGGGEVGGAAKMAVATMMPLAGGTITGKVTLIEVPGGVQITYALENCPPGNHPTHIHSGNGCAANQQGMHWDGARGENIGPAGGRITCGADMKGTLTYVRMSNVAANLRWTIGGGGETDVIGHPVIVHGVDNDQQRHGCGVITAAP